MLITLVGSRLGCDKMKFDNMMKWQFKVLIGPYCCCCLRSVTQLPSRLSQRFFNPHKISWWGQHPTWCFSLFTYSFMHKFSYKIGIFFPFFRVSVPRHKKTLSTYRNSRFNEGWIVLTETIVLCKYIRNGIAWYCACSKFDGPENKQDSCLRNGS